MLVIMLICADCARYHRVNSWHSIGYPFATALFVVIMIRTMMLNLLQGRYWRGTFYPRKELMANKV